MRKKKNNVYYRTEFFFLPANRAFSPVKSRFSRSVGFSLLMMKVDNISKVMKTPKAVDLTSTGIVSAAIRTGITRKPKPTPTYATITETMGMKLICVAMDSSNQPLFTTRVNTEMETKATSTNMPVQANKRLLGRDAK